ncbi:MAG: hypothetical protein QOF70_7652 [Acetobacteraceae bacterium]|jgi:hypothetical protein|nr:hypothetical protein [Acetobacteraceae bacterium]
MTEAYHANSTGGASWDDEGAAAAPGAADWLCLAASPTSQSWRCSPALSVVARWMRSALPHMMRHR